MIEEKINEYLRSTDHQIIAVDVARRDGMISTDLQDEVTVFRFIKEHAPNLILDLAAIKDLCFCEKNKATARATNYGSIEIIIRACSEFGARMIFFSSDYVFGKYDRFWQEDDPSCPTIQYGKNKAASELLIREQLSN